MENSINWRLLKKLYAIYSPSGKEKNMIKFLIAYIKTLPGVQLGRDSYGNLYAWKGKSESYPCIVAHLDQVQHTHSRDFKAIETRDIIFGFSPTPHSFQGLGADDKNGIFIALEALKKYDCLKVAFFKEEEIGCRGSSNCELDFFKNCRYVIQCDRKGHSDFITTIGSSDLCSEEFINDVAPDQWGYQEAMGMMTDVEALKESGLEISVCNISCGYYNPHTDEEITVKRDLEKCWRLVQHIIEDCKKVYPHEPRMAYWGYRGYELDWGIEDELYDILQQDPSLTENDLYDMYHTNFPRLTLDDFCTIVDEFNMMYDYDEEETIKTQNNEEKDNKLENKNRA